MHNQHLRIFGCWYSEKQHFWELKRSTKMKILHSDCNYQQKTPARLRHPKGKQSQFQVCKVLVFTDKSQGRTSSWIFGRYKAFWMVESFLFSWRFSKKTGWWFQICFIFTPTWGDDPIWLLAHIFQMGGEKPPTRKSGEVQYQSSDFSWNMVQNLGDHQLDWCSCRCLDEISVSMFFFSHGWFLDSKNILGSVFFLRDSIPSFFWEHERNWKLKVSRCGRNLGILS